MAQIYDALDERLRVFLESQKVVFVATAPAQRPGRVNVSPKGLGALRVLDPHTVAFLDIVGSGVETIAHLRQGGPVVVMACAFEGSPNILRVWGHGDVVEPDDPEFPELRARFPELPGVAVRSVVRIQAERIADSCGYGVPLMDYRGERTQFAAWTEKKGVDGIAKYQRQKNGRSLDGFPGLRWVESHADEAELSPATARWRARGRMVAAGGHQVFVVEEGSGPTLLLLHGYPTSSYDFRGLLDLLAKEYRCVTLDFLGFGLSDKPAAWSYSLFQQADVVDAVARRLGLTSAHVLSHDMGTSVHGELLARQQEGALPFRIERSTFLNGSMLQWMATITPFQELLASNSTLRQGMALCSQIGGSLVEGLRGLMKRPDQITDEDATVMTELLVRRDGHLRLAALAGYMRERHLHEERWIPAMTRAGAGLQLVWADGDPIAHAELGRELARRCPEARHVELAGLGHFLHMEDPVAVAEEVRRPPRQVDAALGFGFDAGLES